MTFITLQCVCMAVASASYEILSPVASPIDMTASLETVTNLQSQLRVSNRLVRDQMEYIDHLEDKISVLTTKLNQGI